MSHSSLDPVALAASVAKCVAMINVPDVGKTLDWFTSIGFVEVGRFEDDGIVNWGMTSLGKAELMLRPGPAPSARATDADASLWFYTSAVERMYGALKVRQHELAITFVEELYDPFYGGRQFSIREPNGYTVVFLRPAAEAGSDTNGEGTRSDA